MFNFRVIAEIRLDIQNTEQHRKVQFTKKKKVKISLSHVTDAGLGWLKRNVSDLRGSECKYCPKISLRTVSFDTGLEW